MPSARARPPGSYGGLVALVLTVLALGACGTAAPRTVDGRFPVTVTHRFGTTEVTTAPRRVVALSPGDQDVLLALDIVPVGMPRIGATMPPWTASRLADVRRRTGDETVPVETYTQPSVVDVVPPGLAPDLLLAVSAELSQQDYDDDTPIAPVVGPPPGYGDYVSPPANYGDDAAPWQDATRLIGQAVGKPVEADRLVTGVEARFADARARYPQLSGRIAACVHLGGGRSEDASAVPAGPSTACSRFLAGLGLRGVAGLDAGAVPDRRAAVARLDLVVLDDGSPDNQRVVGYELPPGPRVAGFTDRDAGIVAAPTVLSLPVALTTVPAELARALR